MTESKVLTPDYAELKGLVKQKGLLDKQPTYTAYNILITLGLLALSLIFLVVIDNIWLQLLNAVYLAFVFTQLGFVAHDVGHRQAFHAAWKNDIVGYTIGNLLLGISYRWWVDKHNRHHAFSNDIDLDPDLNVPVLAFTREQALSKSSTQQTMIQYQAYYFFPILLLEAFSLRTAGIRFLLQKQAKYPLLEAVLIAGHFVGYFGLVFYALGLWPGLLFVAVHQAIFGLYMALVFAPNHKGMPMLDQTSKLDFLHQQVLTSRNVKANPVTDIVYGGLNYQIEHHLFPGLSRNKLREAQKITRAFCQAHSISYYETSILQSYREIVQSLHEIGMSLRQEIEGPRPVEAVTGITDQSRPPLS